MQCRLSVESTITLSPMQRILVADVPELDVRLTTVLQGYDLAFVRTMREAERRLSGSDFDLVVIGLSFDDSRMFDLLRHVRSAERNGGVPIICLRGVSQRASAISSESLKIACNALDASGFFDFAAYPSGAAADAALRQTAEGLLKS